MKLAINLLETDQCSCNVEENKITDRPAGSTVALPSAVKERFL